MHSHGTSQAVVIQLQGLQQDLWGAHKTLRQLHSQSVQQLVLV